MMLAVAVVALGKLVKILEQPLLVMVETAQRLP
jgi:hypothetical protein